MEENNKQLAVISLREIAQKVWSNRYSFILPLSIAFVVASIYIFSLPRFYVADTKLAPEMENSLGKGSLSSIASSLGFDIGEMQTTDAITPLLYPDLMEDNGFITNLFKVNVKSKDGIINTTYYDYLINKQKKPWWSSLFGSKKEKTNNKFIDAYNLSKKDDEVVSIIRNKITLHVNSKSGVISISVQDQDPLICKSMADSVRENLQTYITNYRTNKARTDYEYYKKLTLEAKNEYEKARRRYSSMSDASTNVSLRSVELKLEDMENDMQLKFNAYSSMNSQLQAAKAKIQERTPAFTMLKGASVPIKPAGPKRLFFVAIIVILAFIGTSLWIIRKNISEIFV